MKTKKPTRHKAQETLKRNTPRGEDPARLNDLNSDKKPAPPQPAGTEQAQQQPTEKTDATHGSVEMGQRPKQMVNNDKPTNPPHTENDGTLWATEKPNENK